MAAMASVSGTLLVHRRQKICKPTSSSKSVTAVRIRKDASFGSFTIRPNSSIKCGLGPKISSGVQSSRDWRTQVSADDGVTEDAPKSYSVSEELEELDSPAGTCDPLCSVDEMSSVDFEASYKPNSDIIKAVTIGAGALGVAAVVNHSWVAENQNVAMSIVFALGYMGIVFEEFLAFNKSGVALLMAVTLWTIRSIGAPSVEIASAQLSESSTEVSEIVFFLLGAMTIVEIVDAHQGFKIVTDSITTRKPRLLLWVVGGITFFLSSVLDNLTSTIVMVSLLRKLVTDPEQRRNLGAVVVIAANAGGAWTPIGDVTTTMLWIHGQISTLRTMQ